MYLHSFFLDFLLLYFTDYNKHDKIRPTKHYTENQRQSNTNSTEHWGGFRRYKRGNWKLYIEERQTITDNTMDQKKYKGTNNDLQYIHIKLKIE
jgi:hypothetical protein